MAAADAAVAAEAGFFDERNPAFLNNKREFTRFLDDETNDVYKLKVTQMLRNGNTRLLVDVNDFRAFNAELYANFIRQPLQYIAAFHAALKTFALGLDVPGDHNQETDFTLGFENLYGSQKVSPRYLMARHLSSLVAVEGIVTRCSIVRPKVVRTVHYCEKTNAIKEAAYHDATSLRGFPTNSIYPTQDEKGNPYTTEFGLSQYRDHQTVTIQEMPERAPAGQLPCSVDVILDDDLVDACKPGDRVQIVGIYRALPNKSQNTTSGVFKTILLSNHVKLIGKDHIATVSISARDIKEIKAVAKRADVFDLLARSVAPSIYGHDFIKRAMVLQLLGGVERNLENGTHIRGDINMLMVGDPSTAKSQFLRFVLNIAPLAINTTGRGSSGVGLTAAVVSDRETGERRLEAGAMVLGDRGIVCIDEFDKMSEADRVAIHEVMEQQTVTIAKAGIHMSLNARCTVVAAANPFYGQYDTKKSPMENVHLPDSLISRFDLLFIVLDHIDPEIDRGISDHVLRNHRYQAKGEVPGEREEEDRNEEETPVYQKFDRLLHGRRGGSAAEQILSIGFLKKFLQYAKLNYTPVLTPPAAADISAAYADLRNREDRGERTMPITARSLETLIRLSTARARARLSVNVEPQDVADALALLKRAMNAAGEAADADGAVDSEAESAGDTDSDDSDADNRKKTTARRAQAGSLKTDERPPPPRTAARSPARKPADDPFAMDVDGDDDDAGTRATPSRKRGRSPSPTKRTADASMIADTSGSPRSPAPSRAARSPARSPGRSSSPSPKKNRTEVSEKRLELFLKLNSDARRSQRSDVFSLEETMKIVNREAEPHFSTEEATLLLSTLDNRNKCMFKDGTVTWI